MVDLASISLTATLKVDIFKKPAGFLLKSLKLKIFSFNSISVCEGENRYMVSRAKAGVQELHLPNV